MAPQAVGAAGQLPSGHSYLGQGPSLALHWPSPPDCAGLSDLTRGQTINPCGSSIFPSLGGDTGLPLEFTHR